MPSVPLFVQSPVSDSVLQALPFIGKGEDFKIHRLKMDEDIFPLLIDVRPCVAVFSITGPEHTRKVCGLLESFRLYRTALGYPSRDPSLRVLLVAEERAVAIERWHELGVHEFIIAPILARALAFKVQRHHHRASVSQIPSPVTEKEEELIVVRGGPTVDVAETNPYNFVEIPLRPIEENEQIRRFALPADVDTKDKPPEAPAEKFGIVASIPELQSREGHWEKTAEPAQGDREIWSWSWLPPKDKQMKRKWSYRGDEPVYDPKRGGWCLRGEKPELRLLDENGQKHRMILVEERGEGPEVIVNQNMDVQEVTRESYSHATPRSPLDTKSPGTRYGTHLGDAEENKARSKRRGSSEGSSAAEEKAPWTRKSADATNEIDAKDDGPGKVIERGGKPISMRTLIAERVREKAWKWGGIAQEPQGTSQSGKKRILTPEEESGAAHRRERKNGDPIPEDRERAEDPDFPSGLDTGGSSFFGESDPLPESAPGEEPGADQDREEQGTTSEEEDLLNDPLIARLQAALMGKELPPTEDLSGTNPQLRSEGRKQESDEPQSIERHDPLSTRKSGNLQVPRSQTEGGHSELQHKGVKESGKDPNVRIGEGGLGPSKGFRTRSGEQKEDDRDFRLKTSSEGEKKDEPLVLGRGSGEANTWSMQNLDESEVLGKGKRLPTTKTDPFEDVLHSSKKEDPALDARASELFQLALKEAEKRNNAAPMDAKEKARLLKSIYSTLNLDAIQPQKKRGFFGELLAKLRKIFQE